MATLYISIGNSDNKLTQAEWADFIETTDDAIERYGEEVYGKWFSAPESPYQNACWGIRVAAYEPELIGALGRAAKRFRQDSIAVAWVEKTEFVLPL